jgi:hypothetical protein
MILRLRVRDIQPGEQLTDDYMLPNILVNLEAMDEGTTNRGLSRMIYNFHKVWTQSRRSFDHNTGSTIETFGQVQTLG